MAFSVDTRRKREEFEGVTSYVESDDEARLASRGAVLVEASPMERIKCVHMYIYIYTYINMYAQLTKRTPSSLFRWETERINFVFSM